MDANEFYSYIVEHFNLGGASCRLIKNILTYVDAQGFVDAEDQHTHLRALLDGAFGLTAGEIEKCRFN